MHNSIGQLVQQYVALQGEISLIARVSMGRRDYTPCLADYTIIYLIAQIQSARTPLLLC